MNAGPDVERLIAGWLVEEAPGRAPDRILESAGRVIDRTHQRRFGVAWRESMTGIRGLAAAAVLGAIVVAGAYYLVGPSLGPSGQPTPSPSAQPTPSAVPTPEMAGPLEAGIYVGPTLQVTDLIASINADPDLTALEKTQLINEGFAIKDGTTWGQSIELRAGRYIERQSVDGVTATGSSGTYTFPDDHTIDLLDSGAQAPIRFTIVIDGDSFTLRALTPPSGAVDSFIVRTLFEATFTIVR
jgi:hypothetical protein